MSRFHIRPVNADKKRYGQFAVDEYDKRGVWSCTFYCRNKSEAERYKSRCLRQKK